MVDITALEKHSCAACGAPAEWDPSRQVLACSYCGTVAPFEEDKKSGEVREIDLVKTLREMPEELRGWKAEKKTVRCQSCNAISVFDPEKVGQNCEFCGSPALVDYEEIKSPIKPESVLPFRVSETQVRESIRRWYASKWFAPGALKKRALLDTIRGIYLPYWTFDAQVSCPWQAESGHYYYTTESYRDSNGQTKTRRVRHVRWEPSSGRIQHVFDDELIPASQGVDLSLLRQIEPFPSGESVSYDTSYLAGFTVEHYQVVLIEATRRVREQMNQILYQLCTAQIPGDTFRNLQINPEYSDQTFKHVLVPVWLLRYDYGSSSYRLIVNGYTGKMAGTYPKSFWKIAFLILAVLFVIFILVIIGN